MASGRRTSAVRYRKQMGDVSARRRADNGRVTARTPPRTPPDNGAAPLLRRPQSIAFWAQKFWFALKLVISRYSGCLEYCPGICKSKREASWEEKYGSPSVVAVGIERCGAKTGKMAREAMVGKGGSLERIL